MKNKAGDSPKYRGLEKIKIDGLFRGKLASVLTGTRMYGEFTDADINKLCKYLEAFKADRGNAVFVEGEESGYMCLVVEGMLQVIKESPSGMSKKLSDIGAGKTIGEMSIIDGMDHSATAIATEPTILAVLTKEKLLQLLDKHPRVAGKILCNIAEFLSQRLRETNGALIAYMD